VAVLGDAAPGASAPATAPKAAPEPSAATKPPSSDDTSPAAVVRTFVALKDRYGILRKYIQVRPGMDDEALKALAAELHRQEPQTWFWLLDDDAQAPALIESLPRTAKGDNTGYPIKWVQAHTVAHVQMEVQPGGGERWVLARGWGSDVITTLD